MELDINTFVLKSKADGLRLEVAAAAPSSPKAIVHLVHGMCEHKERYYPLIGYLVSRGFACVLHDHRGHGASVKSDADLGYFYEGGYRAAVEDVHLVTRWARKEYPDIPLFLLDKSGQPFAYSLCSPFLQLLVQLIEYYVAQKWTERASLRCSLGSWVVHSVYHYPCIQIFVN